MWSFVLIFLGVVGTSLFLINRVQIHSIRKKLHQPFKGLREDFSEKWSKNRIWSFASNNAVLGSIVGVNTLQALYHLSKIDDRVLKVIDEYRSEINGYQELLNHFVGLKEKGEASWVGAINNYKGQVGEIFIKESLEAKDHHVVLATSKNQEKWDAEVDGEKVNFKAGLGQEHIKDHLNQFPDTQVITVLEHMETFSSDSRVTCLEDVSGQEILNVTKNTMENSINLSDFGIELPILTMCMSSVQYFKPVFKNQSDVGTAIMYTAANTAGIGVGTAGGAKLGAMIGAAGGPVGAATGAIVGGLIGAIGGKWLAKTFNEASLQEAFEFYEGCLADYGRAYIDGLNVKAQALEDAARNIKPRFSILRLISPTIGCVVRNDIYMAYKRWAKFCRKKAAIICKEAILEGETGISFGLIGKQLISSPPEEAVFSRKIQDCLDSIKKAVEVIKSEKLSLGYNDITKG